MACVLRCRSLLGEEGVQAQQEHPLRKLLSKGGRKRGPAPAAPPPVVRVVEEVPNYGWERKCQEDMVLKGVYALDWFLARPLAVICLFAIYYWLRGFGVS